MYTRIPDGGVTSAQGFRAGVAAAGLRYQGRPDVALLVSDVPAAVAGVFTSNRVQAAPVRFDREQLARAAACRVIAVNSGIANACTGEQGVRDARRMAELAAAAVGCPLEQALVASTGVIGMMLPMDRLAAGISAAAGDLRPDGGADAAEAIRTTDTRAKQCAVRLPLGGRQVTIGGMCKGSGMIHPNMGTMLGFLTTDAQVSADVLQSALRWATDRSFNCVTVDGDQSTNDSCLLLANGLAGNPTFPAGSEEYRNFCDALLYVATELAKMIAADGEGATRLLEVSVSGAAGDEDARRAARAVVASSLVKTAVHGRDANWGRILSAVGASGAAFEESETEVYLGPLKIFADGVGQNFDEATASELLGQPVVRIEVRLGNGWGRGTAWGCDLSEEYVRINGSYRS